MTMAMTMTMWTLIYGYLLSGEQIGSFLGLLLLRVRALARFEPPDNSGGSFLGLLLLYFIATGNKRTDGRLN